MLNGLSSWQALSTIIFFSRYSKWHFFIWQNIGWVHDGFAYQVACKHFGFYLVVPLASCSVAHTWPGDSTAKENSRSHLELIDLHVSWLSIPHLLPRGCDDDLIDKKYQEIPMIKGCRPPAEAKHIFCGKMFAFLGCISFPYPKSNTCNKETRLHPLIVPTTKSSCFSPSCLHISPAWSSARCGPQAWQCVPCAAPPERSESQLSEGRNYWCATPVLEAATNNVMHHPLSSESSVRVKVGLPLALRFKHHSAERRYWNSRIGPARMRSRRPWTKCPTNPSWNRSKSARLTSFVSNDTQPKKLSRRLP